MNIFCKIIKWIRSPNDYRLEHYLAGSTDIADLDHRLRTWAHLSESEKNRY